MTLSTIERAAAYLRNIPGGIQGANGSTQTFCAAQALVVGFQLDQETAVRLLAEVHNPLCDPPWSERELRHKVSSAAQRSDREPGYLLTSDDRKWLPTSAERQESGNPGQLDDPSFHNVAHKLVELCPVDGEVLAFATRKRWLTQLGRFSIAGLPPRSDQEQVIAALLKTFERDTLVKAGLLTRREDGSVNDRHFRFPEHRLVFPWKSPGGEIQNIQRRRLDGHSEPKYVFPKGRRPRHPFGVEFLEPGVPVAFVEGAADVLSLRVLASGRGIGICPLGLPGTGNWQSNWARIATGRSVSVALDADKAGEEKSRDVAVDCLNAGAVQVRRWRPSNGKDWGDVLEAMG